ncbi:ABC1 family-domain-containing protein [Hysterangium stoloniferum]|nr:ABC1 family-domain-containing protein [Hysterangium stoloniferum]
MFARGGLSWSCTRLVRREPRCPASLVHRDFRGAFSTESSSKASRGAVWSRRVGYLASAGAFLYVLDRQFNASAAQRNIRTLYTGALIAADYKISFKPGRGDDIMALHERVADRLFNLLVDNGGLYIKIGQALAANTALLPAAFQTRFSKLFDDAPQVPFSEIFPVFLAEFGRPPVGDNGLFEEFDENAVASASIAQVHRAKLKKRSDDEPDQWVAVKVQKPAVSKQVDWDLGAYRIVMWIYEQIFDMPVYFLVDFVSSHLRLELDFINEAENANRTAALIASEPQLSGKVYVPKVFPEYTTKKIMTSEYIEGVKLSDRQSITRLLNGSSPHSSSNGSGIDGAPRINWDGAESPSHSSRPINGGARAIMEILVSLFSVQIFQWGFVHCDPHPGNIIIRRRVPSNKPQLVLIDHGLYVTMPEDLRRDYAMLWKGLLSGDMADIRRIAEEWGIAKGSLDLLASGVLLKPWRSKDQRRDVGISKDIDPYEKSVKMKEKLRQFLSDTEKFPKALVFLGRNMRMVQGNNQALGSPVNRVKIIGHWASRSLAKAPYLSLSQRVVEGWRHITYVIVIFATDVAFWFSKVRRWARGGSGGSYEDELEQEMRRISKEHFGVELGENAFLG